MQNTSIFQHVILKLKVFVIVSLSIISVNGFRVRNQDHYDVAIPTHDHSNCRKDWKLDVLYVLGRSLDLTPFYYECDHSGDFANTLFTIRKAHPGSRAATASSTRLCYIQHEPFSAASIVRGFSSLPTHERDFELALQGALVGLYDNSLDWLVETKLQKIVVIVTAAPPAPPNSSKPMFNKTCSDSPPNSADVGRTLNETNAALVVLAYGRSAYITWNHFKRRINNSEGIAIRQFDGTSRTFESLIPQTIEELLCNMSKFDKDEDEEERENESQKTSAAIDKPTTAISTSSPDSGPASAVSIYIGVAAASCACALIIAQCIVWRYRNNRRGSTVEEPGYL